jgi:hypothetical protein
MKTSIRTRAAFAAILVLASFLGAGCANPSKSAVPAEEGGSIRISANLFGASGLGSGSARTILPADLGVLGYGFSATSPSGASLSSPDSPGGAFFLNRVQPGFWTIVLSGKNLQGATVAGGSARVQVEAGKVKDVVVFLAPTGSATGSLHLALSWASTVAVSSVKLTLDPSVTGSPFTRPCTGTSLDLSLPLAPGSYSATIEYFEGNSRIKTQVRALQVYSGTTAEAAFNLGFADFIGSMGLGPWSSIVQKWSPVSNNGGTSTLVYGGRVYFAGGIVTPGSVYSSSFQYASLSATGAAGILKAGPELPYPLAGATLVAWKDRIYLAGGEREPVAGQAIRHSGSIFSIGIAADGTPDYWRNEGVDFAPLSFGHALIWAYDNPLFPPAKPFLVYASPAETRVWPILADGSLDLVTFATSSFASPAMESSYNATYPGWFKAMVVSKDLNNNYLYAIGRFPGDYGKLVVKYIKLQSTGTLDTNLGWQTLDPTTGTAPAGGAYQISGIFMVPGPKYGYIGRSAVSGGGSDLFRLDVGTGGLPTFTQVDASGALIAPGGESAAIAFQDSGRLFSFAGVSPTKAGATSTLVDAATGALKNSQKSGELPYGNGQVVLNYGDFIYSATPSASGGSIAYAPLDTDGNLGAWTIAGTLPTTSTSFFLTAARQALYLLSGSAVYRAPIGSDGSPGAWTQCPLSINLSSAYASYTALLGTEKVVALGETLYIFGARYVFWSQLDAAGNTQAWSYWDSPATINHQWGIPFVYLGKLFAVFNAENSVVAGKSVLLRAELDPATGAILSWTNEGNSFDLAPEITMDQTTALGILAATAGPKGVYLLTKPFPPGNLTTSNYVLGLRLKADDSLMDSRVVAKVAPFRGSPAATFTAKDCYYFASAYAAGAPQTQSDVLIASLDP